MNKILVTGAAGFIGRNLLIECDKQGVDFVLCDRNAHTLERPLWKDPDEWITEVDDITVDVLGSVDAVVHLAALTSVPESVKKPLDYLSENVITTAALLDKCRVAGVNKFVFASSCGVTGGSGEKHAPVNPYSANKAMAEDMMEAYSATYGIKCRALRFTNVYGPFCMNKDSLVAKVIKRILSNKTVEICGDGEQTRDFVYVGAIARALLSAVVDNDSQPFAVQTVCSGRVKTVNQVVGIISGLAREDEIEIHIKHVDKRRGDIRQFDIPMGDCFVDDTELLAGIKTTYDYLKDVI